MFTINVYYYLFPSFNIQIFLETQTGIGSWTESDSPNMKIMKYLFMNLSPYLGKLKY